MGKKSKTKLKENYIQEFTNLYCKDNFCQWATGPRFFGLSIVFGLIKINEVSTDLHVFSHLTRQKRSKLHGKREEVEQKNKL